jgi:mono/diheme cytochrome c family protein
MSKRFFVITAAVALVLAVLIPVLAFRADGDENSGPREVPASLENGQELFEINCGTCHTLAGAGTDGNFGPNLDALLAPGGFHAEAAKATKGRVLAAIENGVDSSTTPGRMPPGIISGEQATEVAEFVAQTAGRG